MARPVVGVDPAWSKNKNAGVSFLESTGKLRWARPYKGDDLRVVANVVSEARRDGATIVVERQFLGRGASANPATFEKLVCARDQWRVVCAIMVVPFVMVYPSTWQSQLKAVPRTHAPLFDGARRVGQRSTHERMLELARELYGEDAIATHDEAAAALIARWYMLTGGVGAL